MALGHGSKKSRSCDLEVAPAPVDLPLEWVGPGNEASVTSSKMLRRPCRCLLVFLIIVTIIILSGGATLAWYFLEYSVWVLEPRVQQQYTARLSILNRNYSSGLSSHTSPAFTAQAKEVQDMVRRIVKGSDLSRYFNSTKVFAFGEGSVAAHFWLVLSVPGSHVGKVTMEQVSSCLQSLLGAYRGSDREETANYGGYLLHLPSFSITETDSKVVELLKASFDCYRYQVVSSSTAVAMRGPNTQRSSCLWHLRAPQGSSTQSFRLELRMEWLLPECRDRLAVYDGLTPTDTHLITSLYGCSRQERVVHVLSSGEWMTVVWKQGLYNYKDPFSLSAQAWTTEVCSSNIELQPVSGVQGSLRTPFYPSYYPPDTNCTWTFTVPSADYGLSLDFEGYELSRANYNQACTQGQWMVQNRRFCGTRGLQPYAERLYLLSTATSVVMTSEVSITGPGLQVHYSLFNQSDPCPGQFLCTLNGLCVAACTGQFLCSLNGLCVPACPGQFLCTLNGLCVTACPGQFLCTLNGLCVAACPACPGQFLCTLNGLCVPACDGIKDCPNGLDERNCVCIAQYQCPEDSQCVDYFKVCDQHPDCLEAMDEENCTEGVQCTDKTYVCADGTCLKKPNPECDFITDCPDASDERHCDCGLRQFTSRVVGGVNATEGEWPWQVSLQIGGRHVCGGALVYSQWVVSAAHCFYDDRLSPRAWTVYLGKFLLNRSSQMEDAIRVQQILLHQYYDDETHDYDLALLRLERPAAPGTLAQPACLPSPTHQQEPELLCWVTGWGALREGGTPSNVLQKVDVRLVSEEACFRSYGYMVTPRMLCAGYRSGEKDACQGDSGGPLVCQENSGRWFLAGVVSWGKGCGRADYYGVYTRVTKLTGWIKEHISGPG
ncbi:transmembrane protease serine 6-like isoform X2 [Salvelinus namaycush]|uniref:Transmembrane protease serine 6-like isoform X2 n=1 Tax=Salvelinus namaycush TaxID=8040 RepID=A0A8U0Q1Z3_SALNM|nr:transmembrane protease serine 6-like isoform X2 [Salvelinus namaycush]